MSYLWDQLRFGCLGGNTQSVRDTPAVVVCGGKYSGRTTLIKALWPVVPATDQILKCDVDQDLYDILDKGTSMCVIYCASPCSYANESSIKLICSKSLKSFIFVILVCTNMYAGSNEQRLGVYRTFKKILASVTNSIPEEIISSNDSEIGLFYQDLGMVINVNSTKFSNELGEKEIEGIDELRKRLPFTVTELLK